MIKIDLPLLNGVCQKAQEANRKRTNYNFHTYLDDTLQRMLNALQPGTYVRPHKHENPDKREAFIILLGSVLVVEFDKDGNIEDHIVLNRSLGSFGIEIAAGTYHTIIALEPDSVVYEVKDGPYFVSNDKGFADWAPEEGSEDVNNYLQAILGKLKIELPPYTL